jgi:hypothetical protein
MHQIALALHLLTRCVTYAVVSNQDLSFDLGRVPTRPRSGFVICDVRTRPALDTEPPLRPSRTAARAAAAAVGAVAPAGEWPAQPEAAVSSRR